MSVNNVATGSSASQSSSANDNLSSQLTSQLGPSAFLQLLTTQLANQDPLNPMDDTQSVAQLAQFSQLQASTNLESSFNSFNTNFGILQSSALIGKQVQVNNPTGNGGTENGTVSEIGISAGVPTFNMVDSSGNTVNDSNGAPVNFQLSQILAIA